MQLLAEAIYVRVMQFWLKSSNCTQTITTQSVKNESGIILKISKKILAPTVKKKQSVEIVTSKLFCTPGIKHGVKWSNKLQGTWIFGFEPLFLNHNWINFEKPSQSVIFLTYLWLFWRLFNSGIKTAAETKKISSVKIFSSFKIPLDPRSTKVMEWNDLRGIIISGFLSRCTN